MFALIILLCSFLPKVSTVTLMMEVYGIPSSTTNAVVFNDTNWQKCMQLCLSDNICILAYQSKKTICLNYPYDTVTSVTKTTSKKSSIVAFKIDNPKNTCPVGKDAPVFNASDAGGSFYMEKDDSSLGPKWIHYTIESTANSWTIGYKQNLSCASGLFVGHSDGTGYCVFVGNCWVPRETFLLQTYTLDGKNGFTYTDAVNNCKRQNLPLASIFYPEDLSFYIKRAEELRYKLVNSNTLARLDGMRTAACQKTPKKAVCMTGFKWTGPAPKSFDNYDWVTDSGAKATADSNCIVLVVNGNSSVKVNVQGCSSTSPLQSGMFHCGGPAWQNALV